VLAGPLSLMMSMMSVCVYVGRDVISVENTVPNMVMPHSRLTITHNVDVVYCIILLFKAADPKMLQKKITVNTGQVVFSGEIHYY